MSVPAQSCVLTVAEIGIYILRGVPTMTHTVSPRSLPLLVALLALVVLPITLTRTARAQPAAEAPVYQSFDLGNRSAASSQEILLAIRNLVPSAKSVLLPTQGILAVTATPTQMQLIRSMLTSLNQPGDIYRLTYTLTSADSAPRQYTLLVSTHGSTVFKRGMRVPILTGPISPHADAQFQYIDIGLNITASFEGTGPSQRLHTKFEQSSLNGERTLSGTDEPQIDQVLIDERISLSTTHPTQISSFTLPATHEHFILTLTAEKLP